MRVAPPKRVARRYTQTLNAPPDEVFPLLCPVREAEWLQGWDPRLVVSTCGVAEPGCVFVTPAEPADAIWVVTRHDPETRRVEFVKVTPGHTVTNIEIVLRPVADQCTAADICYTHTSLGPDGDAFVEAFTDEVYRDFMQHWERVLNHYLTTGTMRVE